MKVLSLTSEVTVALERLVSHGPRSYMMRTRLEVHGSGRSTRTEFVVDNWPDFKVIVCRHNVKGAEVPLRSTQFLVYAWEAGPVQRFLVEDGLIDWTRPIILYGLPLPLRAEGRAAAETCGASVSQINYDSHVVDTYQATADTLPSLPATPIGFYVDKLLPSDVDQVIKAYQYSYQIENCVQLMEYLIRTFSAFCIRHNDTTSDPQAAPKLVGFCIEQEYGALGMLVVEPEYRRRGFGTMLLIQTALDVLHKGGRAFVLIEPDNHASLPMSAKCGFEKLEDSSLQWLECEPVHPNSKAGV